MTGLVDAEGGRDFMQRVFACDIEVARCIAQRATDRHYPARAVIVRQGDEAGETFVLITGRARALLYGLEGQVVLLHEFVSGDVFGAIAQTEGAGQDAPHDADVVAAEPVHAAAFSATDFLSLIESYSSVGLTLSRMLVRRLRATTGRMVERVTLSASGRVHAELLRLARAGDGRTVRPIPVISALAVRVQSTRETVSRTISALERRGLIRREADALVIVAPQRLEEMVV